MVQKGKYQRNTGRKPGRFSVPIIILAVILLAVAVLFQRCYLRIMVESPDTGDMAAKCETAFADMPTEPETTGTLSGRPWAEVTFLSRAVLGEMDDGDLAEFYADMCYLSKTKELSLDEIDMIADNFCDIRKGCPAFEKEQYDQQSYQVFCNIYDQVISRQIKLDLISEWAELPVPEILCLFFSSKHFESPETIYSSVFDWNWLRDDEIARIADAFFANPVMTSNAYIPANLIQADSDEETVKKAWQHLQDLAESERPDTSLSSEEFTDMFYHALISTTLNSENPYQFINVAEAMMVNPYYDIKTKFQWFCNAYYSVEKKEYTDGTLAFRAVDILLALAKDPDPSTRAQLNELVDLLADDNVAEALSDALASG